MSVERTVTCPSCSRPVRLLEEELTSKRGFCAVCSASFNVTAEMFGGPNPFRSMEVVEASLSPPPQGGISIEERTAETTIRLRKPIGFAAVLLVAFPFVASIGGSRAGVEISPVFWWVLVPFWLLATAWTHVRWERIRITPDELIIGRYRAGILDDPVKIPLDQIRTIGVTEIVHNRSSYSSTVHVVELRTADRAVGIGMGLGRDDETMRWVAGAVDRSVRRLLAQAAPAPAQLGRGDARLD
jgi:hypothetical protein